MVSFDLGFRSMLIEEIVEDGDPFGLREAFHEYLSI